MLKKAALLIFFALALTLACGEEGKTVDPVEAVVPASPADVLTNVQRSFNQRGLTVLEGSLGPTFVFYFDEDDVGYIPGNSEYVIPESWNRTEFLATAGNMLELAYSIDMDIPAGRIGKPAPEAETYRAENVSISFLVMISELYGYIANQGYCNYEFAKFIGNDGRKYWRLTGWWDNTQVHFDTGAEPMSFGRVLALFYPQ